MAVWCFDRADATGDARYCGLARTLEDISRFWDIEGRLLQPERLRGPFDRHLDAILVAPTAEEGAGLARLLREEVDFHLGSMLSDM